jgi:3-phenylpropionate/trans-cinnamate dioxygenase ferredoxin subunit
LSGGRVRYAICDATEIVRGDRKVVTLNGIQVGIFNLGDRFVAYRNLCPHQGAPVCVGRVGGTTLPSAPGEYVYGRHGKILHCPWHGWQFDLETGQALGHRSRLAVVQLEVEDGQLVAYLANKSS